VKRLVQKRKIITEEESLKPQEDATKKGKVKESDQLKHRGVTSQLQGGWNNRNKPPKVDETGPKTSGSNSVLKGKEEITTPEKIRKLAEKVRELKIHKLSVILKLNTKSPGTSNRLKVLRNLLFFVQYLDTTLKNRQNILNAFSQIISVHSWG
jgi:hypothetical protein